jgi:predicted TIM-barrel fold metal-dependent hydrolase
MAPTPIDRRSFLGSIAAAGITGSAETPRKPLEVIDCHAHIYSDDQAAYPTLEKPYRPPPGKGTIAHLLAEMRAAGVKRAAAIQTATYYGADNRFLADSARRHTGVLVGVCNLNSDDPASPALLARYIKEFNVRGLRSTTAKSGKLDDPGANSLWTIANRLGITVSVLINRDKVEELETLARRYRSLPIVIDHCLNMKAGPELDPTLEAMVRLAKTPNLYAKLSFIPTGSAEAYPCRDLHQACRSVIAAFTPERCVWGSCFPCELWCPKATYAQHLQIFTQELGLKDGAKAAILDETPRKLWFERRA